MLHEVLEGSNLLTVTLCDGIKRWIYLLADIVYEETLSLIIIIGDLKTVVEFLYLQHVLEL